MSLRNRLRQKLNNKGPKWDFDEHYIEFAEGDEQLVLIRVPAQSFIDEKQPLLAEGKLSNQRFLTLLAIHCVFAPKEDPATGEPLRNEDGEYELGERIWDGADIDFLEGDSHEVGGWLQQLKNHVAEFFQEKAEAVEGNSKRRRRKPSDVASS